MQHCWHVGCLFFFWGGGGVGGDVIGPLYLRSSIRFLFCFLPLSGDGLISDGYSQRTVKFKTTYLSNWPFRDIDSKITKSGRILEYC